LGDKNGLVSFCAESLQVGARALSRLQTFGVRGGAEDSDWAGVGVLDEPAIKRDTGAGGGPQVLYWCAVLGTAFVLRLVVSQVVLGDMPLVSDARFYAAEGEALSKDFLGNQSFFWPPGMPMLLAGFYALLGSEPWVSRLVVCAVGTLQVAFSIALARELFLEARAERATGWLAALYPPAVMMSGQTYSQHLAGVALTALALFAIRLWRTGRAFDGICAGIAWGVGCLTRPSMLSVGPALMLLAIVAWYRGHRLEPPGWQRRVLRGAGLCVVVTGSILAPVILHHLRLGAGPTLSTNNEANFFLGNNPYTPYYKTWHLGHRELSELDPAVREYLERFRNAPSPRAAMRDEALRYVAEHPGMTGLRTLSRIRAFWGFDYLMARDIQLHRGLGTTGLLALTAIEASSYALVMVLALVTLLCGAGELRGPATATVLACVAAYQLPYTLTFSAGTYHFPVIGLLFPFTSLALARDPRREEPWLQARQSRRLWIALVVFAAIQIEYGIQAWSWM
jgi:4-amino-4-deoxy-L-arabinose transferase-like glycosyltransferase